jgi:ketopantoate hydroxymethyltransferase
MTGRYVLVDLSYRYDVPGTGRELKVELRRAISSSLYQVRTVERARSVPYQVYLGLLPQVLTCTGGYMVPGTVSGYDERRI